jgi:tetraacyldisaccharide 4'-kinase
VRLAPVAALWPLGRLWGHFARLRRELYESGLWRSSPAPLPAVSVGNLAVGGSGKTPMCAVLARALAERGLKAAILSRGYRRRRLSPDPLVVSAGQGPLVSPAEAGDEPWLLAEETPAAVICARRRLLAALAAPALGAEALILDDGFQHLALARDLDLLMLRSQDPFERQGAARGLVLPAGPLREPEAAHRRAQVLVAYGPEPPGRAFGEIALGRPVFWARLAPVAFQDVLTREILPLGFPRGLRLAAFCGLARPESFYQTLASLGLAPRARLSLPDHEGYGRRTLSRLAALAPGGEGLLLTTAKDAVKLSPAAWGELLPGQRVLALQSRLELDRPEELVGLVLERLGLAGHRGAA